MNILNQAVWLLPTKMSTKTTVNPHSPDSRNLKDVVSFLGASPQRDLESMVNAATQLAQKVVCWIISRAGYVQVRKRS